MASLVLYRLQHRWQKAFKISFRHHLRAAISPFIQGVSGSFTKIERNVAIERPSTGTPVVALQLEHQWWTSATRVFCNGIPFFPMVSSAGWSPSMGSSSSRGSFSSWASFSAPNFIADMAESA